MLDHVEPASPKEITTSRYVHGTSGDWLANTENGSRPSTICAVEAVRREQNGSVAQKHADAGM